MIEIAPQIRRYERWFGRNVPIDLSRWNGAKNRIMATAAQPVDPPIDSLKRSRVFLSALSDFTYGTPNARLLDQSSAAEEEASAMRR